MREHTMKHLNLMLMFFLSGCGNDWMWIPDRQDIKFNVTWTPIGKVAKEE